MTKIITKQQAVESEAQQAAWPDHHRYDEWTNKQLSAFNRWHEQHLPPAPAPELNYSLLSDADSARLAATTDMDTARQLIAQLLAKQQASRGG